MKNPNEQKWPPAGFMRVSEVAVAYFPLIKHTTAAMRRFRQELEHTPGMMEELQKLGYTPHAIELSPRQIGIVARYWGMPAEVTALLIEQRELRVRKLHRDKLFD